jgi:DNA-binding transcriptional ArsR family regulator
MPSPADFRSRTEFQISPRFDLFLALGVLFDRDDAIHPVWSHQTRSALSSRFFRQAAGIGADSAIWALVPDALSEAPAAADADTLLTHLAGLPPAGFQQALLVGALHDGAVVARLQAGTLGLAEAVAALPPVKREWLGWLGLYPYRQDRPIAVALESLIEDAGAFQRAIVQLAREFWQTAFAETWRQLMPQMVRSIEAKRRLFDELPLGEFADRAMLLVTVDERQHVLQAARGGYRVGLDRIRQCVLLPSAFNHRRYWSAYESPAGVAVYLPYFDPELTVDAAPAATPLLGHGVDLPMVFKALGDPTRFALLTLIARAPTSSVELAKALGVSKPTISHHVSQLRLAGLIRERQQNNQVLLSARTAVLENLSALVMDHMQRHQ